MNHPPRIALILTALVAIVFLAACGTPSQPAEPTATATTTQPSEQVSAQHNDADTMFVQMMIVHHRGAIEMADLARADAESADVKALAERISAAQGPEIEQMTSWLTAWGEPVEADGHAAHPGMKMNGMTQEEMLSQLNSLSGTDFDRAFLKGMIAHHEGAVEMSEAQLADGENREALALAGKIISDQEAEIEEMQGLLKD